MKFIADLHLHSKYSRATARNLDFERAAFLRDQLRQLKELPEFVLLESKEKKRKNLAARKHKRHKKKHL